MLATRFSLRKKLVLANIRFLREYSRTSITRTWGRKFPANLNCFSFLLRVWVTGVLLYYIAISKIKLPQKFHATRYLSIQFITLRVLNYCSARAHNLSRATWLILDLAAAGSIKNNFLFCRCFWRGVRSNAPRPKFLACLLRQRKSIMFFSECWKCPMLLLDFESCLVSFDWPFLTRSINTNNSFQYRPVMQANSHEHAPRIPFPFPFKRLPGRVPSVLKRCLA